MLNDPFQKLSASTRISYVDTWLDMSHALVYNRYLARHVTDVRGGRIVTRDARLGVEA